MTTNRGTAGLLAFMAVSILFGVTLTIALTYLMVPEPVIEPRVITQRDVDDAIGNFIRDARDDFERGGQ